MKTELENAADKYEATEAENRTLVQNMQNRLDNLLKENEELKTTIATKNYEINDLEKSNKVKDEVSNKLRKELNDIKIKVNKEKNEMTRNHKSEIKYWRKELGDEKKTNNKLREKLVKNGENITPEAKEIKSENKRRKTKNSKVSIIPSEAIICSISAQIIPGYTPEYFCGEQIHPACELCKKNSSSSSDPFSSFPASAQPPSLVSHWLLPHTNDVPRNPSSIVSLLPHCVQFTTPGNSSLPITEALEMMSLNMKIQQEEMKNWLEQRLKQIMAPSSKLKFRDCD